MPEVTIYTDGAARGNPNGPGGYGAVVRYTDAGGKVYEREYSAGFAVTTNNRMELMGAIIALENLKVPCKVTLYSDSKYLVDAFNEGWAYYWRTHEYRNKQGDLVKNDLLWRRLMEQVDRHETEFIWVKGHNGHPENERCDELATSAADSKMLFVDDGGDLRNPKLAPQEETVVTADSAGPATITKETTAAAEDSWNAALDCLTAFSDGKMSREDFYSKLEVLRAKIDAEMELLEQMEEAYYAEEDGQ